MSGDNPGDFLDGTPSVRPTKIRVLRLIEYEYDTPERMEQDMMEWTHSHVSHGLKMRSTKLDPKWIEIGSVNDA